MRQNASSSPVSFCICHLYDKQPNKHNHNVIHTDNKEGFCVH